MVQGLSQWEILIPANNSQERFENAMAVIDKHGKPDLFVTMTGDPNWPEIKVRQEK